MRIYSHAAAEQGAGAWVGRLFCLPVWVKLDIGEDMILLFGTYTLTPSGLDARESSTQRKPMSHEAPDCNMTLI